MLSLSLLTTWRLEVQIHIKLVNDPTEQSASFCWYIHRPSFGHVQAITVRLTWSLGLFILDYPQRIVY